MNMRLAVISLLLAAPAWAQEASPAPEAQEAPPSPEGVAAADPIPEALGEAEVPLDPVAAWEADRQVILDAQGVDLEAFEFLARPLVVFAENPRQPQVIEQMRLLEADLAGLAARDVVIILDTDPDARTEVRRELRPRGFALVLVDKDGRVVLRQPAPTSVREVVRAIDRSPIRQEEMRNLRRAPAAGRG